MRVLMLGWEFPPFISGGLGTACYGLTRALDRLNVDVTFVLPKSVDAEYTGHVKLVSPQAAPGTAPVGSPEQLASTYRIDAFEHVTFKAVPSRLSNPYNTPGPNWQRSATNHTEVSETTSASGAGVAGETADQGQPASATGTDYAGDLIGEIQRYANMCARLTRGEQFDAIHAHDWMTYPAGLAVAALSGKPLIVHVHSTEFDRSGDNVHQVIYDIERRGMHGAMTVVCVSHLTRNIVLRRYGVSADKVHVVYNGIEANGPLAHPTAIRRGDKIVLFLGRITMQKGPEYFVAAAKKVLDKVENVKFVMAGSGDMARPVIELAAEMGIGHKVLFTGFLRGKDVDRVYQMADVYVMPSVSEPFGLAALEAIRHDVPVIISKNSGVAEVIRHALKVDFWDIDEMANKVIAVLKHPPLSQTLREHADFEVRNLSWDGAAAKCQQIYTNAIAGVNGVPVHA